MHETRKFSEDALQALKEAVSNALSQKRKLGQYAIVVKNGKPVKITPEQLTDTQS